MASCSPFGKMFTPSLELGEEIAVSCWAVLRGDVSDIEDNACATCIITDRRCPDLPRNNTTKITFNIA